MSHSIDSTRRYVESFLAALKDCGHSPENVRAVLRELIGDAPDAALRDEFAGLAMAAAITACGARGEAYSYRECAALAYEQADEMLKARSAS